MAEIFKHIDRILRIDQKVRWQELNPLSMKNSCKKSISKKSRPLDAKYFDCIKTIKVVQNAFQKPNKGNNYFEKKAFNCKIMHLLIVSFEKIL